MAARPRRMKYIRDIPPLIRQQICEILDDLSGLRNWRNLAAVLGFNNDCIHAFELSMHRRGGSPTEEMLTEWDHGNHTIDELFRKLYELQHVRCMMLLKDLVSPSLHHLLEELRPASPDNTGAYPANIPPTPQYNPENHLGSPHTGQSYRLGHPPGASNHQPPLYYPEQKVPNSYLHQHQQPPYGKNNHAPGTPTAPTAPSYNSQASSNPTFPAPDPSKMASTFHPALPGNAITNGNSNITNSDNMAPQYHHHRDMGRPIGPPMRYVSGGSNSDDLAPPPLPSLPDIDALSSTSFKARVYDPAPSSTASSEGSTVGECLGKTIKVDFAEISKATDDFSDKKKLGEGAFGKVYYGQLSNMTEVAIKKIVKNDNVMFDESEKIRRDQMKEISALTWYRHVHIVPLISYSIDEEENLYLIFPFMKNGSLEKNLENKSSRGLLDWRRRHRILEGAARGIFYLHTGKKGHPLIHQDIKSANILLDENFVAKIADFGLARPGPSEGKEYTAIRTNVVFGTMAYLAPEFMGKQKRKLSTKLDVYSFGVVMMEVVTGEKAGASKERFKRDNLLKRNVVHILEVHEKNPQRAVEELVDPFCPNWPSHHVLALLQLADRCTDDLKRRPTMEQVLKDLIAINKKVEEESTGSAERNVQPTENTEPLDSRPGEESSCPISNHSEGFAASADPRQWPNASDNKGRQQVKVEVNDRMPYAHTPSAYMYGGPRGNMQPDVAIQASAARMEDYAGLHLLANGPDLKKAQGPGNFTPGHQRMLHQDNLPGQGQYEARSQYGYTPPMSSLPSTSVYTGPPLPDSTTSESSGSSYYGGYPQPRQHVQPDGDYQQQRYNPVYPPGGDEREQFGHLPEGRNGQRMGYNQRMGYDLRMGYDQNVRFNPNSGFSDPRAQIDPRMVHDSRVGYDRTLQYTESDHAYPQNGYSPQNIEGSWRNGGASYQPQQGYGGYNPSGYNPGHYPPGAFEGRRSPPDGPGDLVQRGTSGHPYSPPSSSLSTPSNLTGSVPSTNATGTSSSSQYPNQPESSNKYPKQITIKLTSYESDDTSELTSETSMLNLSDRADDGTVHRAAGHESDANAAASGLANGKEQVCLET